jgi:hypothetical protein
VCLRSSRGGGGGGGGGGSYPEDRDEDDGLDPENKEDEKEGRRRAQIHKKPTYLVKATVIVLVSSRRSGSKVAWRSWKRKGGREGVSMSSARQ